MPHPQPKPLTIQSLSRGLSVLSALNERSPASLAHLVEATGLAKATVVRILNTLRADGYVELADRAGYRALPKARLLSSSLNRENAPKQAVRSLLNDFARAIKWPAEFLVREGSAMVIEVSNRDIAPIGLKQFEYTRFPLLSSAAGIALLAWSKPGDREDILRAASASLKVGDPAEAVRTARADIERTRKRGYGLHDYEAPIEGTRALALPVFARDVPIGAVALIILRDAVPQSHQEQVLVPRLQEFAAEISRQYALFGGLSQE